MAEQIIDPNYSTLRRNLFFDGGSEGNKQVLPWQGASNAPVAPDAGKVVQSEVPQTPAQQSGGATIQTESNQVSTPAQDVQKPPVVDSGVSDNSVIGKKRAPLYVPNTNKGDYGVVDYLRSLVTTPEQEEKYRKDNKSLNMILSLADAARNIGNIISASNYATPQKFNNPVLENEQRYKQEKLERERRNMAYYQAKQNEDAKNLANQHWMAEYAMKLNKNERDNDLAEKRGKMYGEQANYYKLRGEGQKSVNANANRKAEDEHNERVAKLGLIGERIKTEASVRNKNAALASAATKRANAYVRNLGGGTQKGKVILTDGKGNSWSVSSANLDKNWAQMYYYLLKKGKIKPAGTVKKQLGKPDQYIEPSKERAIAAIMTAAKTPEVKKFMKSIGGVPTEVEKKMFDDNDPLI